MTKHLITIAGIGPGREDMMSIQAYRALEECDVIIGYPVYTGLLEEHFRQKEMITTPMREEVERCRICFREARKGKRAVLICSGDAGVYGLASLMYGLLEEYSDCKIKVIPGITAANSGAAVLGAPLNHDYCVISLSDLMTPWEVIAKRLASAAEADFCIALYNPGSRKRQDYLQKACDILLEYAEPDRSCGYVENIGRTDTKVTVCMLKELRESKVNMFTTVFIGNSNSKIIDGKLVTDRGYQIDKEK